MAEIDSRKASLIAEIEVSRFEIRRALRQCEANLNPVAVLRRSVVNNSVAWLSSAGLLGVALSQIVRLGLKRSPSGASGATRQGWDTPGGGREAESRPRPRSWVLSLSGFAYDLLKPVLIDWATAKLSSLARSELFTGPPQTRNGVRRGVGKREVQSDQ
jgi:hypothetical protein